MANSYRIHYFHLIWSTKGRRNYIQKNVQPLLYAYIEGIIRKNGANLIEIGGVENHVHLLIELSTLDHFTKLIKDTKVSSTTWLKKEYPSNNCFAWQDGYASYSVSYSQLDAVRNYIRNQEAHHKNTSYEQEYRAFLNSCKIEYDERYLFDE